jgi:phosphatidylserine/phosphatidylglycerophosphate/cardiolipin synthase-like enzyme
MARNYINSLPLSKKFYVCSYGFKKGFYNIPEHAKLLIGLPYLPDCTPGCPYCEQRRTQNKEQLILALNGYNYKLSDKIHLKLLIIDDIAIVGSRNLTGSEFQDIQIVIEDYQMVKDMEEYFLYLWDNLK